MEPGRTGKTPRHFRPGGNATEPDTHKTTAQRWAHTAPDKLYVRHVRRGFPDTRGVHPPSSEKAPARVKDLQLQLQQIEREVEPTCFTQEMNTRHLSLVTNLVSAIKASDHTSLATELRIKYSVWSIINSDCQHTPDIEIKRLMEAWLSRQISKRKPPSITLQTLVNSVRPIDPEIADSILKTIRTASFTEEFNACSNAYKAEDGMSDEAADLFSAATISLPPLTAPLQHHHLDVLCREFREEIPAWKNIADRLNIKDSTITDIKMRHPNDCQMCFRAMLGQWIDSANSDQQGERSPAILSALLNAIKEINYALYLDIQQRAGIGF